MLSATLNAFPLAAQEPVARRDRLPVQLERTIAFETSEGTFMSVDVSPHGRRIAFDLLGDIYTIPAAGGRATRLTDGPGYDARPVWSPDGKRIAFISDRTGLFHVWVVDAEGKHPPRRVTRDEDVAADPASDNFVAAVEWSPDGGYVMAGPSMYSLTSVKAPLPHADMAARVTPWAVSGEVAAAHTHTNVRSPGGGQYVYYTKYDPERGTNGLWRYDRAANTIAVFFLEPTAFFMAPMVSPDGRWVVYQERETTGRLTGTLRVRDMDTRTDRVLITPSDSSGFGFQMWYGAPGDVEPHRARYGFTPDSRALVIGFGGRIHRLDLATGQDEVIPFTASVNQRLAPMVYNTFRVGTDSLRVRYMRNIQRSPDGRTIVFAALRRLYVVRRAGGMSRPLVLQPEGQFHPAISPDGRWVAYVTWHDTAGGHLWRLPLTGGTPERLSAAAGLYERPTWSPDGRTIAVIRSEISLARGLSVLQLVSVADRRVRVIAKNLMGGHTPSFSGDGRRIYSIRHAVAAPRTLVSVRVDGSDERESWPGLVPRDETAFEAAVPSPDGKYVAVIEYGNLYLVHMPPRSSPAHAGDTVDAVPTVVQVTREGAYDPVWNSDGKTLTWSFAHTLYHANVDRLLESARLASASGSGQSRPNVAASASASATPIRLTVPRHKPRGTLALRGARVITMRGNEVIPAGTIVVTDNRITAVGPVDAIAIPAAATVLDVSGKTIIPGLMDLHAHYNTTNLPIDVLAQNWWGMLANLAHGVTTVRDPSAPRGTYAYEELLEAGITTGPRLFGAPAMAPSNHKIETPEDARGYARQYKALGATFMKTHSGWPRRERQWMIAAARAEGLNIAVHLSDETGVLLRWLNLSPLIDGVTGTEHNILWSDRIYGDVERFWAQAGTWQNPSNDAGKAYARFDGKRWNRDPRARAFYVPPSDVGAGIELGEDTHSIGEPEASWARTVAGILRAGGNVSIGTHGGFFQGAGVHWEMWVLARSGLTNHEALRVATLGGARGIGIQQDLGSIEVGKLADLVVLDRNPLENIEHSVSTVYVMKNGVLYDATTLTTVWPTRRALPAWRYPGWTYNE